MLKFITVFFLAATAAQADSFSGTARVVDGDTLDLGFSANIRLHGIDAPEISQRCGAVACGREAKAWLDKRIEGKRLTCTQTAWDSRYNRPVAKCKTLGGKDIGQMIVAAGMAWAYVKYSNDYVLDEKTAALNERGFWAYPFEPPAQHRAASRVAPPSSDCPVKGNISPNSGEKIYHVPGQRHYDQVRINAAQGEACFDTEAQARAAGWRKSRR
ncbi:MAG: thermonuclease family protein [Litoreibacter sp.]|nr:thermonuclease family protein [Litoreibacter sp.]